MSSDLGDNWQNVSNLLSVGQQENFAAADIVLLVKDPQDNKVIYAGSRINGLYFTVNGGTGWQRTLENVGGINDIAVSYFDHCTIFTAAVNQLYRSTDCTRNWQSVFNESRPEARITTVVTDSNDSNVVFAANNLGSLYQSTNQGKSWKSLYNFAADVREILISKKNIIYVATINKGIFRSVDRGATWNNVTDTGENQWRGMNNWRDLLLDPNNQSRVIYANNYGIFESLDDGQNWRSLPLLTPPSAVTISSLSVSYQDSKKMYYLANNTFYLSVDGGQNWATKKIATTSNFVTLLTIAGPEEVIYAGAAK